MKIYLTGFMGSGKTTYGRQLADKLDFAFHDLDEMVEKQEGHSIAEIFEKDGEAAFRKAENRALMGTEALENAVIATGGGTPAQEGLMKWMNDRGTTVYLKLFEPKLHERLKEQKESRPLLKDIPDIELQDWIYIKLRERVRYYHQAQIVLQPEVVTPEMLAEKLRSL